MAIIIVYPNTYEPGKSWGSNWRDLDDMREYGDADLKDLHGFTMDQLVEGPVIEGIQVYHIKDHQPDAEDYATALRRGFNSLREHEFAVMLDHSWGFDMFVRGEYEDESGQYQSQQDEHRRRWERILGAVRDYLQTLETERGA
jgi:hypothetical protein